MEIKNIKTKGTKSLGILSILEDEDITKNSSEIEVDLIDFNEMNFYGMSDKDEDIRDLAESIKEIGLLHNVVVRPNENGRYTIISGEKRTKAFRLLFSETNEIKWKKISCKIREDIKNEVDEEITLIKANRDVRERSETLKAKEIERLENLYGTKKASGEKVGIIRKRIAEDLGVSERHIQRYRKVNELIDEFKIMLDSGEISLDAIEHFAGFEPDVQKSIYDSLIQKGKKISREEAREIKNEELRKPKAAHAMKRRYNLYNEKELDENTKQELALDMHFKKTYETVKSFFDKMKDLENRNIKLTTENEQILCKIKEIITKAVKI